MSLKKQLKVREEVIEVQRDILNQMEDNASVGQVVKGMFFISVLHYFNIVFNLFNI